MDREVLDTLADAQSKLTDAYLKVDETIREIQAEKAEQAKGPRTLLDRVQEFMREQATEQASAVTIKTTTGLNIQVTSLDNPALQQSFRDEEIVEIRKESSAKAGAR